MLIKLSELNKEFIQVFVSIVCWGKTGEQKKDSDEIKWVEDANLEISQIRNYIIWQFFLHQYIPTCNNMETYILFDSKKKNASI